MAIDVCALNDIPDGVKKSVKAYGTAVLLLRTGDTVDAVQPKCPHMNLPLGVGKWDGKQIHCRFHGARFDAATGACAKRAWLLGSMGKEELGTWPVTVEGGRVHVEV